MSKVTDYFVYLWQNLGLPAREAFHFHCFFKTFDIHIHLWDPRENPEELTACILDRPRHNEIIEELKKLKVNLKLITDGDVSGALLVTDEKYEVDIFLGIGGGPEGVLAASALDTFNCNFQGRFLFKTEKDKARAKKMGIDDLTKKYELNEIVTGDSIFCATGITSGDLVAGIEIQGNDFFSETLVTHKSSGLKKVIKLKQNL